MSILEILAAAQGGTLFSTVGIAAGLDAEQGDVAMRRLVPAVAGAIAKKASDPEEFEDLMDVLEDGEHDAYLDDPRTTLSKTAIEDGEDILGHVYGSLEAAHEEAVRIGPPAGVAEDVFARMMTLAATLCVAAIARRNQQLVLPAAGSGNSAGGGIVSMLISALITGLLQGLSRAVKPRRRRRRSYGRRYTSRRREKRRTRRRRSKSPSLGDLIGDLLK